MSNAPVPITPAMVQAAEPALRKSLELQAGYRAATVATLRAGLDAMTAPAAGIPDQVLDLIRDLTDEDDCSFDHHRGCQAHGYLHLEGRKCPHQEAKELLAAHRPTREL